MNTLDTAVGKKLRLLRASLDHAPDEFAAKVRISTAALYKYETGAARIPADTLYAVVKLFNVPMMYFFSEPLGDVCSQQKHMRTTKDTE